MRWPRTRCSQRRAAPRPGMMTAGAISVSGTSKTPPPEEKQIEIERARSVALAAALASVMALDRAEAREKRAW